MRTLSMRVPEALDHDLEELAQRRGVSKSALIRDAMVELVSGERDSGGAPAGSFLAAAEDLAGCVDGPEDLSYDKDHLDGYGQ